MLQVGTPIHGPSHVADYANPAHTVGMATTDNDLVVGQRWAYRARQVDDVVEVEVLKLGTQKPARVLVGFVDESFGGAMSGYRRHV